MAAIAGLTLGVVVAGASPAQALTLEEAGKVIEYAQKAYEIYKGLQGGPTELELATERVLDAVADARDAIISEVDGIGAADVRACTNSAVADVENLPVMSTTLLESFATNATLCTNLAAQYINAFSDRSAVNDVAFAMNTVGPLALIARSRLNLSSATLTSQIAAANSANIQRLTPACTATPVSEGGRIREYRQRCVAFHGEEVRYVTISQATNFTAAITKLMAITSHAQSVAVLPVLNRPASARQIDVLWGKADRSQSLIWRVNEVGQVPVTKSTSSVHGGQVIAAGDFNGDGHGDVLTRAADHGIWVTYLRDGSVVGAPAFQHTMVGAVVGGVGDFDGDKSADVLWRLSGGQLQIWFSGTKDRVATPSRDNLGAPLDAAWQIKGAGDFNGNGRADILLRHSNGQTAIWYMSGALHVGTITPGTTDEMGVWQIAGVGDFDADGHADTLWLSVNGEMGISRKGHVNLFPATPGGPIPAAMKVKAVADVNRDGHSDIVWQHETTKQVYIWFMINGVYVSQSNPGHGDNVWQLEAVLTRPPGPAV
ncbi:FG-GAP repeat domain-containing protein [Catellatospora aurea]|uniref:FG-GAP repeat domain-containing protein n=1 Tax=Catellatospora aurea TaxID=1337874 RepID=A0ABW2H949_9ACTN